MHVTKIRSSPENFNQRVLWSRKELRQGDTICRAIRRLGLYDYFVVCSHFAPDVKDRILKERTRFTDRNRCGQYIITRYHLDGMFFLKVCRVSNIDDWESCACGVVHDAMPAYVDIKKENWWDKYRT